MGEDDSERLAELLRELQKCKQGGSGTLPMDFRVKLRAMARKHLPHNSALRIGLDSEDLAHDGIAQLIDNVDRFRGKTLSEFFAFVKSVVGQQAARQARWQTVRHAELRSHDDAADYAAEDRTPSVSVADRENLQQLMTLVEALEESYREPMLMQLRGQSNEEIAEALGIRVDLVRKRLSRALQTLRGQFGQ